MRSINKFIAVAASAASISGCSSEIFGEESVRPETQTTSCSPEIAMNLAVIAMASQGFDQSKIRVVSGDRSVAGQAGNDAFTSSPLMSEKDYIAFINSGSQPAELVKSQIEEKTGSLRYNFESNTELVEISSPVQLLGNTAYDGSTIYLADQSQVNSKEAFFITFSSDVCRQYEDLIAEGNAVISTEMMENWKGKSAITRADCGNPQLEWPVPARSKISIPEANPSTENPLQPTPGPTYYPPQPPQPPQLLPKEPSRDFLVNPYVPPVQGPGSSNNQPAQPPIDSGNGGIPAPRPQPTYSHPPSGPGSGDVWPAPTIPPAPADGAPTVDNPAIGNPGDF